MLKEIMEKVGFEQKIHFFTEKKKQAIVEIALVLEERGHITKEVVETVRQYDLPVQLNPYLKTTLGNFRRTFRTNWSRKQNIENSLKHLKVFNNENLALSKDIKDKSHRHVPRIQFQKKHYEQSEIFDLFGTFAHEVCHYICWLAEMDSDDGDYDFETALKIIGAPQTNIERNLNLKYMIYTCEEGCCLKFAQRLQMNKVYVCQEHERPVYLVAENVTLDEFNKISNETIERRMKINELHTKSGLKRNSYTSSENEYLASGLKVEPSLYGFVCEDGCLKTRRTLPKSGVVKCKEHGTMDRIDGRHKEHHWKTMVELMRNENILNKETIDTLF